MTSPGPRGVVEIGREVELARVALAENGHVAVADALALWEGGVPFDDALDLPPHWRSELRRAKRDRELADLARRHFPSLKGKSLARAISLAGRRYEATGWLRDRRARHRPDGRDGALYDILSLGDLPGEDRLRQIFKGLPC